MPRGGVPLAARINQYVVVSDRSGSVSRSGAPGLVTPIPFVQSLAHLGVAFLLFVIGLRFRLFDLLSLRNLAIALFGVIIPWVGGSLLMTLFGYQPGPSILIGTASTATSIAITAPVLTEQDWPSAAGTAIIGAAVIDDVLTLIALSITDELLVDGFPLSGNRPGADPGHTLHHRRRWCRLVPADPGAGPDRSEQYRSQILRARLHHLTGCGLSLCPGCRGGSLSPIVGVFIAGIFCGQVRSHNSRDLYNGADYLRIIFASIFFVSLGPRALADIRELTVPMLVLLLLTLVTLLIYLG